MPSATAEHEPIFMPPQLPSGVLACMGYTPLGRRLLLTHNDPVKQGEVIRVTCHWARGIPSCRNRHHAR